MKMRSGSDRFPCRLVLLLAVLTILGLARTRALADTVLEARLVPAIIITGPLHSLQQIQYSTNLADTNAWMILSHVRLDTTPKPFYDATASGGKRFYRTKTVGVWDTNLVWIPPGAFLMGSPTNEQGRATAEGPQTLVTLTKGFFMGRFEVRNVEWLAYSNSLTEPVDLLLTNYLQRAVRKIVFENATNYCQARTLDEQQQGLIPAGWMYRLPTEAEWEYACRAGTTTPFAIGSGVELRNDAVRQDAMFLGTTPYPTNVIPVGPYPPNEPVVVGSYAPNAFGLYDMHGNVGELTLDVLGTITSLPGGSVTNPIGGSADFGTTQTWMRGGSYADGGVNSRATTRRLATFARIGFRVVLVPTDAP
jgi:formylglycine-generating enzyme required for sulfatase activity